MDSSPDQLVLGVDFKLAIERRSMEVVEPGLVAPRGAIQCTSRDEVEADSTSYYAAINRRDVFLSAFNEMEKYEWDIMASGSVYRINIPGHDVSYYYADAARHQTHVIRYYLVCFFTAGSLDAAESSSAAGQPAAIPSPADEAGPAGPAEAVEPAPVAVPALASVPLQVAQSAAASATLLHPLVVTQPAYLIAAAALPSTPRPSLPLEQARSFAHPFSYPRSAEQKSRRLFAVSPVPGPTRRFWTSSGLSKALKLGLLALLVGLFFGIPILVVRHLRVPPPVVVATAGETPAPVTPGAPPTAAPPAPVAAKGPTTAPAVASTASATPATPAPAATSAPGPAAKPAAAAPSAGPTPVVKPAGHSAAPAPGQEAAKASPAAPPKAAGNGATAGSVNRITRLQEALAKLGYYHAPVTGVLGPKSRDALAAFVHAVPPAVHRKYGNNTLAMAEAALRGEFTLVNGAGEQKAR